MPLSKNQPTNLTKNSESVREDVEKLEPLCCECKMVQPLENTTEVPEKIKHKIIIWLSNPTSGYKPKSIQNRISKRYWHIHVHYSTIHNSQEVDIAQMFNDGWMDKENVLYTKKKDILSHATSWINFKDIMLSDISQSRKENTAWFHSYVASKAVKLTESESRMMVTKGWGKGEMRRWRSRVQF